MISDRSLKNPGAHNADTFHGGEAGARATMEKHGIKPPRECRCEKPAFIDDGDGLGAHCITCGRRPA